MPGWASEGQRPCGSSSAPVLQAPVRAGGVGLRKPARSRPAVPRGWGRGGAGQGLTLFGPSSCSGKRLEQKAEQPVLQDHAGPSPARPARLKVWLPLSTPFNLVFRSE